MCWIKNKTTTVEGYPFYLYSTLIDQNFNFVDLQSLLKTPPMNPHSGQEYTHYESQISTVSPESRRRVIMAMQSRDSYDMYDLINKGILGAEHRYIDTIKKIDNKFVYDIEPEVVATLEEDGIVEKGRLPIYDKYRYDWAKNPISSRKITRVGGANVFEGDVKSISEQDKIAYYTLNERSRAISRLLTTDPVTFVVHGLDFLYGDYNTTIGNKLRVKVLRNTKTGNRTDLFDKKKSGDYLIFACKHSFTPREYTITFSGVKLSNGDIK